MIRVTIELVDNGIIQSSALGSFALEDAESVEESTAYAIEWAVHGFCAADGRDENVIWERLRKIAVINSSAETPS
jgi:hypothetical protein